MWLNCPEIYVNSPLPRSYQAARQLLKTNVSINFLDFPESHCNANGSFWPGPGHFDMGHFSQSRERDLYYFGLIFSHDSR